MGPRSSKEEVFVRLFSEANERWGKMVAQELRSDIERASESIWQVEQFKLETDIEPSRPPGRI